MGVLETLSSAVPQTVGSVLNFIGLNRTNNTNKEIASNNNNLSVLLNQKNNEFNAEQADINRRWQEQQQDKQNAFQEKLSKNQLSYTLRDMRKNGLNVAAALGGSFSQPSTGSNAPQSGGQATSSGQPSLSTPTMQAPDFSGFSSLATNVAQARLANAQAKAQEIENQRQSDMDYFFAHPSEYTYLDSDGNRIDDVEQWSADHPNELPDVVIPGLKRNTGAFLAKSKYLELQGNQVKLNSDSLDNILKKSYVRLQKSVYDNQSSNNEVLRSLSQMPIQEYKVLCETVAKYSAEAGLAVNQGQLVMSQKELADMEAKAKEDSNISLLFDKLGSDLSFGDKFLAVLAFIFNTVNSHIGQKRF